MSITIAALALMAAKAAGDYIRENPRVFSDILKSSKPVIHNVSNELARKQKEWDDEVAGWSGNSVVGFNRIYTLPSNKSLDGVTHSVENLFCSFKNTKVTNSSISSAKRIVTCSTKLLTVEKVLGNDLKITVELEKEGNKIRVDYSQDINEIVRVTNGLLLSFAPIGAGKIYGARERHKLPSKIDDAIRSYLT